MHFAFDACVERLKPTQIGRLSVFLHLYLIIEGYLSGSVMTLTLADKVF
jgi:hypothetical protein